MAAQFSSRIGRLSSNAIRDILTVIDQPGMVSFAGGLPAPESFVRTEDFQIDPGYLQYGASAGEAKLRDRVAQDLLARGLTVSSEQVMILSGSQQGIDLVAKLMIDDGTSVAIESPTYLAALQAFDLFGAKYQHFSPTSAHTLLESTAPALLYTIPTFQNPTGYAYSRQERMALADTCDQLGCVLFEDDPYRELMYEPCERTPISAFVQNTSWIYQSSFSKTLAPGLRLGYLVCSEDLYPDLLRLKQAADLHSNRIAQQFVIEHYDTALGNERLARVCDLYRDKRDRFHAALIEHFTDLAQWDSPQGGLFFWLRLNNASIDTDQLLKRAVTEGFAFMPGRHFFDEQSPNKQTGAIRLNFSHASDEETQRCLAILARLVRECDK